MTEHESGGLAPERGSIPGWSAGDAVNVKDESQDARTFVRKHRPSADGAKARAEPSNPATPKTLPQSTLASTDGRHIYSESRERIVVPRQERAQFYEYLTLLSDWHQEFAMFLRAADAR